MIRKIALSAAGVGGLVLLLLYMQGTIGGAKVAPGEVPFVRAQESGSKVAAEEAELEDLLEWPGTLRSRTTAQVGAKLLARVVEVKATAGQAVKAGDPLALLDDRDLRARLDQARSAAVAAEAQAAQAEADHARVRGLLEKQAATARDLEAAEARSKAMRAQAVQARSAIGEIDVLLTEAIVRAPFDGVVAERQVEPGDTAAPGRTLFVLHDPSRLRLEATVPEGWAGRLAVGAELRARIDAAGTEERAAKVEEIAASSDPQSRTVLVKAALADVKGLRPGLFGRLLQPGEKRKVLLIPSAAVVRSGQLETVTVAGEGPRHVRTGKARGDRVEVLSGLRAGDEVIVPDRKEIR